MATRPSKRVRVQTDLGNPQLQVAAQEPYYARARSQSADNARALEAALGVGSKVFAQGYEMAQQKGAKDAAADFTAGKVDDKRRDRNKAYNSIITKLETEAAWVDDEKALDEHLNSLDLDNISSEDLDNEIKGFFRKNYLNANADELQVLAPAVAEKRMKILQTVADRQQQLQVQRRWGEVAKIFDRDLAKVDANGLPAAIDWDKFNTLSTAVNGNANATDALFSVVADAAIRSGRPELMRSVPEKWANGAQSWLNNPKYADQIRTVESQARANRERLDEDARKVKDDKLSASLTDVARTAVDNPGLAKQKLDLLGNVVPYSTYMSLVNFMEAKAEKGKGKDFDARGFMELRMRIATDPRNLTDQEFYNEATRVLPEGDLVALSRLTDDLAAARQSSLKQQRDGRAEALRGNLVKKFTPPFTFDQEANARFAQGMLIYDLAYLDTQGNSEAAFEKASEFFTKTEVKSTKATGDVRQDAHAIAAGALKPADILATYGAVDGARKIAKGMRDGSIPREIGEQMLEVLESAHQ